MAKGKTKLLIVDDEPLSIKFLYTQLLELGFDMTIVHSAEAAWELLKAKPEAYQIVLLDRLLLEGIDGVTFLKRLKFDNDTSNIPVIMMTARAETDEFIDAIMAGVYEFLYKPVDINLLTYVIDNALHQRC